MEHVRKLLPVLGTGLRKGKCGKIAVIGGSIEYTGAPFFAAISALRLGADLVHVICAPEAAPIIKTFSPELIVHPGLEPENVLPKLESMDAIVFGPGLGRSTRLMPLVESVLDFVKRTEVPFVVDADQNQLQAMVSRLSAHMGTSMYLKGKVDIISNPGGEERPERRILNDSSDSQRPFRCAFCIVVLSIYWIVEVVPVGVTSLLPIFLFPVLGIESAKKICLVYFKDSIVLFICIMTMTLAVEETGLHRRIALKLLCKVGTKKQTSFFFADTACTALMIPIALAIVRATNSIVEDPEDIEGSKLMDLKMLSPSQRGFCKALVLACAHGSLIGGTAIITSTGPNLCFFMGPYQLLRWWSHPDVDEKRVAKAVEKNIYNAYDDLGPFTMSTNFEASARGANSPRLARLVSLKEVAQKPTGGELAESLHIHPLYLAMPATVACSFAFMLPMATPPNAIVFDTKIVGMLEM
ncbi:putative YjeF domain protein, partial [Teladorsagia circumcincta]